VLEALSASDDPLTKRGIDAVREMKIEAKVGPLANIVRDDKRDGTLRLAALEATANLPQSRELLVATFHDSRHMILRKRAAELLAQYGVTDVVLAVLPNAPEELAISICGALARTDAGTTALLDLIEQGKVSPRLLTNKAVFGPMGSMRSSRSARRPLPKPSLTWHMGRRSSNRPVRPAIDFAMWAAMWARIWMGSSRAGRLD
jgi:hypothetical protein